MNLIKETKNIFIVGIKGAAMSNLAIIFQQMGKKVVGCDEKEEFITDCVLKQFHITVLNGFGTSLIPYQTDLLIYSAAHNGADNPQVQYARQKGIIVMPQAKVLGELLKQFKTSIAVCGCHGKTTTTSLLTYAFKKLEKSPSYMVGAPSFNNFPGGAFDKQDYFVIEADEYGEDPPRDKTPKLLSLHPDYIICANIDFDHPDVYKDIDETKKTFLTFFDGKKLFLCADDPHIQSTLSQLKKDQYETFGFTPSADLQISNSHVNQSHSSFKLTYRGKKLGLFTISLFGEKNISNAAGVILALLSLGFDPDKIKTAIADFSSVKRRFELVYKKNDTYLFDDYGHHPHEIEATIAAARARFKNRRLIVLFQPHTYSRTQFLLTEFAQALSSADHAYVLPIFPSAREDSSTFSVTSKDIVKAGKKENIEFTEGYVQLINQLYTYIKKGDIIFTMGAGDIYKLKNDIIKIISASLK